MLPFAALLLISSYATSGLSVSLDGLSSNRLKFTLNQVAVNRTVRHPIHAQREIYWKYGWEVPDELNQAAEHLQTVNRLAPPPGSKGKATVVAKSIQNDLEYLIAMQVGNHDLMLDLDTGSSDL
jgi:hypothetical protein